MDAVAHVELPVSSACAVAVDVVRRLRDHGHSAYLVGGCVRDVVLGLAPKDYDVATDARPQQVKQLFRHVVEVGVAFGVVRVRHRIADSDVHEVEVATFRADGTYLDGRRPSDVRFTDAREDVLRRDFTLNGLLLDPLDGPSRGLVVDWVGGLADLRAGVLRAIGEPQQRFGEDALRLLRAVRFAARFGLAIDAATQDAVRQLAGTLRRVSVERISAEVLAMLTAPTAPQALGWLSDLGLAEVLWPQLLQRDAQLRGAARRLAAVHRDATAALAVFHEALRAVDGVGAALGLAVLADGDLQWLDSPERQRTLRLSNRERQDALRIGQLVHDVDLGAVRGPTWSAAETRWLRDPLADAALLLLAARSDGPAREKWLLWRGIRAHTPAAVMHPSMPLDGQTLQAWGFAPGPAFKQALIAAEDALLQGGGIDQAEVAARSVLAAAAAEPPRSGG